MAKSFDVANLSRDTLDQQKFAKNNEHITMIPTSKGLCSTVMQKRELFVIKVVGVSVSRDFRLQKVGIKKVKPMCCY